MQAITQQFEGVSPAQFDALCEAVKQKTGVVITDNAGTAHDERDKWEVVYLFDPAKGDLEITVTKAPFPESMAPHTIAEDIAQLVNGVIG